MFADPPLRSKAGRGRRDVSATRPLPRSATDRQQKRGVITVGGVPTCTLKWKFRNAPCSCSLPHLGGPTLTGPAGVISTCSCGGGGACALPGRTTKAALTSASAIKTTNLRIAPPFARGLEPASFIARGGRAQLHCRPVRAMPRCPHSAPKRAETAARSHAGSSAVSSPQCEASSHVAPTCRHSTPGRLTSLVMKGSPVRVRASAFCHLQGFLALHRGLSEGLRGPPEVYAAKWSRENDGHLASFLHGQLAERSLARVGGRDAVGACQDVGARVASCSRDSGVPSDAWPRLPPSSSM